MDTPKTVASSLMHNRLKNKDEKETSSRGYEVRCKYLADASNTPSGNPGLCDASVP
jgi:hypothetical protein